MRRRGRRIWAMGGRTEEATEEAHNIIKMINHILNVLLWDGWNVLRVSRYTSNP